MRVSDNEPELPRRSSRRRGIALLSFKLAVSVGCLWYVTNNIDIEEMSALAKSLDMALGSCALLAMMLQILLAGVRLGWVVDVLAGSSKATPRRPMIAICAIGIFFGQVLPYPGGDAMRSWLLARLGHRWTRAVTSVLIDRGIGVLALLAVGLVTMLFPSSLIDLVGNRLLLLAILGTVVIGGLAGIAVVPYLAPILERARFTRPAAYIARAIHSVLYGSKAGLWIFAVAMTIHTLSVLALWLLARAEGLALPLIETSALFTLIAILSFLPISIGGWGVREVAVTTLLQSYGMAESQGLFLSVSFGLLSIMASLPGAIVYALYSPAWVKRRSGT